MTDAEKLKRAKYFAERTSVEASLPHEGMLRILSDAYLLQAKMIERYREAVESADEMADAYLRYCHQEVCPKHTECLCKMQVAAEWKDRHADLLKEEK